MAVIVETDLDIVQLVARMRGANQMLAAGFDPAHRMPEPAGQKCDQHVLGIDMPLAAKPAADIGGDDADPRLGQAEQPGRFAPHKMHYLGRGPDRHGVGARIIGGDDAAALDRHRGIAVVVKATLEAMRCLRQGRLGIAAADRE